MCVNAEKPMASLILGNKDSDEGNSRRRRPVLVTREFWYEVGILGAVEFG